MKAGGRVVDGICEVAVVKGVEEVGETKSLKMCHGLQEHPRKCLGPFFK